MKLTIPSKSSGNRCASFSLQPSDKHAAMARSFSGSSEYMILTLVAHLNFSNYDEAKIGDGSMIESHQ